MIKVSAKATGRHYTWERVSATVHNVLFGKLWIENYGDMTVLDHADGGKACVRFSASNLFGGETREVFGAVQSGSEELVWFLRGAWDSSLQLARALSLVKPGAGVDSFGEAVINLSTAARLTSWKQVWDGRPENALSDGFYNFTRHAANNPGFNLNLELSNLVYSQNLSLWLFLSGFNCFV